MDLVVRQLNEMGSELFRDYLYQMSIGTINSLPHGFLTDSRYSIENTEGIQVQIQNFGTKFEMVQHLYPRIRKIKIDNLYYRKNLWSWLAAAYLDSLCPQNEDGTRNPGNEARYILTTESWYRYYRHLIATPVRLYSEINDPDLSILYLYGPPDKQGDFFEQLASRQEIATVKGILEAIKILYWDKGENRPKTGVTGKDAPGGIRRLVSSVLPQFQMTYDLNSMSGDEILGLLPEEFTGWKQ